MNVKQEAALKAWHAWMAAEAMVAEMCKARQSRNASARVDAALDRSIKRHTAALAIEAAARAALLAALDAVAGELGAEGPK